MHVQKISSSEARVSCRQEAELRRSFPLCEWKNTNYLKVGASARNFGLATALWDKVAPPVSFLN